MLIKISSRKSKWEGPVMFITVQSMHYGVETTFYSCFCIVYSSRLSPSWASKQRVRIHVAFFRLAKGSLRSVDLLYYKHRKIFSIMNTERSSREWALELKWFATGFSRRQWLISDRWPFIHTWMVFSVSPMYCFLQGLHSITEPAEAMQHWSS